jgi:hypothetical protein
MKREDPATKDRAPESPTTDDRVPGHCQACGVDLPPGHVYCTRVCAMWDRREHLGREVDEPVESWPA